MHFPAHKPGCKPFCASSFAQGYACRSLCALATLRKLPRASHAAEVVLRKTLSKTLGVSNCPQSICASPFVHVAPHVSYFVQVSFVRVARSEQVPMCKLLCASRSVSAEGHECRSKQATPCKSPLRKSLVEVVLRESVWASRPPQVDHLRKAYVSHKTQAEAPLRKLRDESRSAQITLSKSLGVCLCGRCASDYA